MAGEASIVVELTSDLAAEARRGSTERRSRELTQLLAAMHGRLDPLHARPPNERMAARFVLVAPAGHADAATVEALLACPGVRAAYLKLPDEPPGG